MNHFRVYSQSKKKYIVNSQSFEIFLDADCHLYLGEHVINSNSHSIHNIIEITTDVVLEYGLWHSDCTSREMFQGDIVAVEDGGNFWTYVIEYNKDLCQFTFWEYPGEKLGDYLLIDEIPVSQTKIIGTIHEDYTKLEWKKGM